MNIVFFGSSSDSVIVLDKLSDQGLAAVVTQPPRPLGRKQIMTPTPVELWAKEHTIPVLSFATQKDKPTFYEDEAAVINTIATFKPDLLISASYGELIPWETIQQAKHGGLNVHPSLLPRWRGADPVPWAILANDHQTGATVLTLEKEFDEGKIIGQKKIPLTNQDTHLALREKLFTLGAELLLEVLPGYLDGSNKGIPQNIKEATFARRLERADGYIPWELIQQAIKGELIEKLPVFFQQFPYRPSLIADAVNALYPWPGVWSELNGKRIKLLSAHMEHHDGKDLLVLDQIQLEGKTPTQFTNLNS